MDLMGEKKKKWRKKNIIKIRSGLIGNHSAVTLPSDMLCLPGSIDSALELKCKGSEDSQFFKSFREW